MWNPLHWDHNGYYHPFIIRQLPDRMERALDVGCGAGVLARLLSQRTDHVDAVDVSPEMIDRARSIPGNINWILGDVLDDSLPLETYDAVTAVASLHHLPLHPALTRLASLVKPGGTLVVVGLYKHATPLDYATTAVASPANMAMGLVLTLTGRSGKQQQIGMPIKDPTTTLTDLRTAAHKLLPGARIRRHLFWRYSLIWHR